MNRWEGKVAIVTGASSGIGAAVAEALVKAGVVVVALARRFSRLQELSANLEGAGGKLYPRQCDVSKEEELLGVFEWVNAELGGVDILVNNAGGGNTSKIIDDDVNSFRKIMNLNVLATAVSIREAVASMKSRNAPGYIININSVDGHYLPESHADAPLSLYSASKFAVTALTETVRKELAGDPDNKIKITSISPGLVSTEFFQAAGFGSGGVLASLPFIGAKDVAAAILHVLGTRDSIQVTEVMISPVG